jgi:hypothetical protein
VIHGRPVTCGPVSRAISASGLLEYGNLVVSLVSIRLECSRSREIRFESRATIRKSESPESGEPSSVTSLENSVFASCSLANTPDDFFSLTLPSFRPF